MKPRLLLDADEPASGSSGGAGNTPGGPPARGPLPPRRARPASVVLRQEGENVGALMDPANKSLADALKITFRLIQFAMLVLFGLFAFSGLQPVKEGESGLRLTFGRLVERDVAPGMRFAMPAPIGEIVRVPTGNEEIEDSSSFYPFVSADVRARGPESLPYMQQLNPARDGSILTGDQAVAHLILRIQYRRADPALYAENVLDRPTEDLLILSAARRGMVRACAEISIDNLLREQDAGAIARRALTVAQETLDQSSTGITLERINLVQRIPPAYLRASFNKVQDATAQSGKVLEEATTTANQTLNSMAGLASRPLIDLIEQYDHAIEQQTILADGGTIPQGDLLDAPAILARIDSVLEGRPVTIAGQILENQTSGEATSILQQAAVDRARLVNGRQASLQMFLAKLDQYNGNPQVMLTREWTGALGVLLSRDFTQKYLSPDGGAVRQLVINQDPNIIRDLDAAIKRREATQAAEERTRSYLNQPFSTPTGTFARPD